MLRFSFFILFLFLVLSCKQELNYRHPLEVKIKGLTFTGPGRGPLEDQMFGSMAAINANFVAVVPEATAYRQTLEVVYDFENQWFGERKEATIEGIRLARANGLKVMLKPHLTIGWDLSDWQRPEVDFADSVSRMNYAMSAREFLAGQESKIEGTDSWRGALMTADQDWNVFAKNYEAYIMDYAHIADSLKVELFCIGTEMKRTALEKPQFWRELIAKVRQVYSGPITYAANWDSYHQIAFWDELDYIGVDAYFPLSDTGEPTLDELKKGWQKPSEKLAKIAATFEKPVLFTEWGYENEEYVGREPWVMGRFVNTASAKRDELQRKAYQSMFESLWDEPWMKGVFVWRWSPKPQAAAAPDYSPRAKPAAELLREWFQKE